MVRGFVRGLSCPPAADDAGESTNEHADRAGQRSNGGACCASGRTADALAREFAGRNVLIAYVVVISRVHVFSSLRV